jgi:hypothetical protein
MQRSIMLFLLFVLVSVSGSAQSTTAFKGRPIMKISEGGTERNVETVPRDRAINLECVISKIGENYYWASRENKQMVRVDLGGAFVTFVAIDGGGYVRIVKPEMKSAASLMGDTETKFDYVEHLLSGLKSVTYYGSVQR